MNYDTNNKVFQLAIQLVNQSSRNIFLTGKAGTGKTTFLKYIRENCPKQIAVVAPTGVAAINAGGVTIHSFFQLPLTPFVPDANNRQTLLSRLRFTKDKRKLLQELELLIIDEISMVRCDTLDAIDTVLRHVRRRHNEQFGGIQLLFIGDMHQLPPVVPEEEWRMLSKFYNSHYFFDSIVIKEQQPAYIEFNKIYRQSEEQFIYLLNQIRNNELNAEGASLLETRYQPQFYRHEQDGFIVLTTHNYKADAINTEMLQRLGAKMVSFKAEITGEFNEKSYPAEALLQLKEGAQVMFIKNDSEKNKRYFNGKIGVITKLSKDEIFVKCKDGLDEIEVKKEAWENIRYSLNKKTGKLEEEILGSFIQYPLRLAWAITIHKSQGLTFEKAIIDVGEAFASGQVYVALSRCTNLNGLILQSKIQAGNLRCDERIVRFSQNNASFGWLKEELQEASKNYQRDILLSLFDFGPIVHNSKELMEYLVEQRASFNADSFPWIEELLETISNFQKTAEKFHQQLILLFQEERPPEENTTLLERIKAAASYFIRQIEVGLEKTKQSPAITDSRQHAKEYNESVKEIFRQLSLKKHLLDGFGGQLNMEAYHRRKNNFVLPAFHINAYAGAGDTQKTENQHPELYQQLRKLRDSICAKKDLPIYFVAGSKTLDEMTYYLPQTPEELQKISGFGKAKTDVYRKQFAEIVRLYCSKNNLSSRINEKKPKRERKSGRSAQTDTKAESFKLYKEGKSAAEIAAIRNLTIQTIEGHLSYYVQLGEINIEELISNDKLLLIEPLLKDFEGGAITPIKEKLGNDVSYGEIRLAIAWLLYQSNTTKN